MENFSIYNPTKVFFGKGVITELPEAVKQTGSRVLLMYGKGSIKKNGIYDEVVKMLIIAGVEVFEYSGIKSNPVIEDVEAALEIVRNNNIDCVLAVGGGSVIDSAKTVAASALYENHSWDLFEGKLQPVKALPLIVILTLAASGSEMNSVAIVQNDKLEKKSSFKNDCIYPKYSFLDPSYTTSVPLNYTAYGITDLCAHAMEAYFGGGDASLSDRFVFSIIHDAIEYGTQLLDNLENYELRAKIMYAATCACNNLPVYGRKTADWGVHRIGHILSLVYDVPHGASLSIVYPAWMKVKKDNLQEMISNFGFNLFGCKTTAETIEQTENMFKKLKSPTRISELEIPRLPASRNLFSNSGGQANFDKKYVLDLMIKSSVEGFVHKLSYNDVAEILDYMM